MRTSWRFIAVGLVAASCSGGGQPAGTGQPEETADPGTSPTPDSRVAEDLGPVEDVPDTPALADTAVLQDIAEPADLLPDPGPPDLVEAPDDGQGGCGAGGCPAPCSPEAAAETGLGCRYLAVQLENIADDGAGGSPASMPFGVTVVNPSADEPLTVSFHDGPGAPALEDLTFEIPPAGRQVVPLGPRPALGTGLAKLAFELTGDRPFAAYQSNPFNGISTTRSNDASRLLPLTAEALDFVVVTGREAAFVAIAAAEDGTEIAVRPTAPVAGGGGVSPMEPGTIYNLALSAGEVLNLRAAGDLTGTEVWSTRPVAVFGGSVAARSGDTCCADHLEEQVPPVATLGTEVVAVRASPRGGAPDYWRVVAADDGTTVSFSPAVSGPVSLDRGQWVEIPAASHFVATATGRILVAQVLASAHEATLQGRACTVTPDCPKSQICAGASGGAGRCFSTCQVSQDDCPSSTMLCDDRSDLPGLLPGQGYCRRTTCGPLDGPCPPGSTCAQGSADAVCALPCTLGEPCDEPGATCAVVGGKTVCAPATCEEADAPCPGEATCALDSSGAPHCRWSCAASNACALPDYRCLSSALYAAGAAGFSGAICVPPKCSNHADCPAGHRCQPDVGDEAVSHCKPVGDPSLIIATPVEQYVERVSLDAPGGYPADYVTVVAPAGASVWFDGDPVEPFELLPFGASHQVIVLPLEDGAHALVGDAPIGVTLYGFGDEVSYGTFAVGPAPDEEDVSAPPDAEDPDTGDVVDPPAVTWTGAVRPLLGLRCAPCHVDGGVSGGVSFDSYGVVSQPSEACPGVTVAESIVIKVKPGAPCTGTIMPPVGDPLSEAEVLLLEEWLAAGAPE